MDDHEIPHHFICPISLQIMKDPVTVATGITYDRDSIQRWQSQAHNNTCPVTNQPLPIDSDFTPNHNLRRLIQSWRGSDQVPVQQSSFQVPNCQSSFQVKVRAVNLIKNLNVQDLKVSSLISLVNLASESENNRVLLKEAGVVKAMIQVIVSCYRNCTIVGLQEALNVVYQVRFTRDDTRSIVLKHDLVIHSLTWVLDGSRESLVHWVCPDDQITTMKLYAIVLLKDIIHNAKSLVLERLNHDFFKTIVRLLQDLKSNNLERGIKEVLHVMLSTCTWPRNCSMMIDSGAVFELIELELGSPEKATTELIMAVLFHLCSLADGRAELLGHAAGVAVVTKRIATVSPKVDERALMIVSLISKLSGTDRVVKEMVRVGTVEKLCMVLQVNGVRSYARDKAREILKRHSNVWKDSPCLDVTHRTRYPS